MTIELQLPLSGPSTPAKALSPHTFLRGQLAGGILSTVNLPNPGFYQALELVGTADVRRLHLELAYQAAAIGGQAVILAAGSAALDEPLATDDAWFPLSFADAAAVASLAGTFPAFSGLGGFSSPVQALSVRCAPLALLSPAAAAANSRLRLQFPPLDVSGCRWVQLWIAEVGVPATRGSVALAVAGSV